MHRIWLANVRKPVYGQQKQQGSLTVAQYVRHLLPDPSSVSGTHIVEVENRLPWVAFWPTHASHG